MPARATLLLLVASLPRLALAERAVRLVDLGGSCPSGAEVVAALGELTPDLKVSPEAAPSLPSVRLTEVDGGYRVEAAGLAKTFFLQASCQERARAAAVFIALALDPPTVTLADPPRPTAPLRAPKRSLRVELEAAGTVDAALENAVAGGAAVDVTLGSEHLAGLAGVAASSPVTLDVAGTQVRLTRFPLLLAMRLSLQRGRVSLGGDLGLAASILISREPGVAAPRDETRLDLALHAALFVRVWMRSVAPFLALHAQVSPVPYHFTAGASESVLGSTPRVWLGASLGISWRIR